MNKEFRTSNDEESSLILKHIRLISIVAVIFLVISVLFFLIRNNNIQKKDSLANVSYEIFKPYLDMTQKSDELDDESRKEMVEYLRSKESSFSSSSFDYSRLNLYIADLCKELNDKDGENEALKNIINNSKTDNFLYPVACYRLALNLDTANLSEEATVYYSKIWDNYSSNSVFSERALFSLFRINYGKDKELARKYYDLLSENFKDGIYTTYCANFFESDENN